MRRRIGLIVNPIAGMGGAVGLKGTDGDLATRARALGAEPLANERLGAVLATLGDVADCIDWLTANASMGRSALDAAGMSCRTVYSPREVKTRADDTQRAAREMLKADAELIVFAGGDGTATDIMHAIGRDVPVLGVPAGVKMHSAVFAISPRAAAEVIRRLVDTADWTSLLEDAEVMDRPGDEASPELLGYLKTPVVPALVAPRKAATQTGSVEGACRRALDRIREARGPVLIGPGMTMRSIKQSLGMDTTLLGVDAWHDGRQVGRDLSAAAILELLEQAHGDAEPLLVIGVVGGQGFLFGRGNQQLSADVLRRVGHQRILVISSMEKLVALPERRLYVDTGVESVDRELAGFMPVLIGERQTVQVAVGMPPATGASRATSRTPQTAAVHHG